MQLYQNSSIVEYHIVSYAGFVLTDRCQSVRVDGQCSNWLSLAAPACLRNLLLAR